MNNSDEGMGFSVVVYAIAMMCGLALFVMPIMWLNGERVYANPGVTALRTPGGPAYVGRPAEFPLANLREDPIVSPAMLAELEAKSPTKKERPARRASAQSSHRSYAQVQAEPAEQRPQRRGFFSLF